jgi:phosphoribosylamine--glycine ligase
MRVLLVGSGGREDALAWALARSPRIERLRCTPGNAGIARRAPCLPIRADDVAGLVEHARSERYDLVVVGPEAPLVAGLADRLRAAGIAVFGPGAAGARIEGSKVFAKLFMERHGIPTARFRVFDEATAARAYLRSSEANYPLVVKADGLAAGKGVLLCDEPAQAVGAATDLLERRALGEAGARIVVEELLRGHEASFFVISDGEDFVELATCRDYKRAGDGDTGPNTGGMGTYSPAPHLDAGTRREVVERVVRPTIGGLAESGAPYRGVLYIGLMLTTDGPRVLEYNARFGDPETQVLVPRLDGDWLDLLHAAAVGDLGGCLPTWKEDAAVCVVMASAGYPGERAPDRPIEGLEEAEALEGVVVFHAGTRAHGDTVWTAGGRVLGVTALGADHGAARERAYAGVARIHWEGERHRTDIASEIGGAVLREREG